MHAQHITDQQLKETRTNTPHDTIFLDQCPQKNPMQENQCSYLRVFLLSNIRVQSGCQNWPTQQRISLAAIPQSLREISWLKPRKTLMAAPQYKTALATLESAQSGLRQPLSVSRWPCVSPKRPCVSSGSLCVSCAGLFGALCSTCLPLRGPA